MNYASRIAIVLTACVLTSAARSAQEEMELPEVELRGYGAVSAKFTRLGANGSQLRIHCASDEKAKLVHAKYLSDLHALLDVKDAKLSVEGIELPVVDVPQQGQVAAFRSGKQVFIVSGADAAALANVVETLKGKLEGADLAPSANVPMYLDSWDKYGFRFYYWPFQMPQPKAGEKRGEWRDYNVLGEFDFAQNNNHAGLICWMNEERCDFAEGMTNQPLWDWAARASAKRNLPFIVNSCTSDCTWLLNRYRNETQMRAPDYCGGYYTAGDSFHAGFGHLSWCAGAGLDASLAVMQKSWREYAARDNVIEFLEPHGEIRHGEHDSLTEYGPLADKSYRVWLKQQYGEAKAVSRRWYGDEAKVRSWEDVRVPELANFLGFDSDAVSLSGAWRVQREEVAPASVPAGRDAGPTAPEDWYLPSFKDETWPTINAPNSDIAMFLGRRPTVFRRHFSVDAAWKDKHPRVWLYVWDLNRGKKVPMPLYLNGKKVGQSTIENIRHWTAVEVTSALTTGENMLAFRLPEGFIGYRVYLSGHEPVQYPYLGDGKNAQWADFVRWQAWTRMDCVRRGLEGIRQVDPNRSVICMAPDAYYAGLKRMNEDYGGHFHNTGYMAGWWADPLPMLMRSSDMPFSSEPGGPAPNLSEFKMFMGNWMTEGVNAIHYFIHIGDVYWNDEIRPYFTEMQPVINAIGKIHVPKADVAMLLSDDVENLTGYPWERGGNGTLPSGYVPHQINVALHKEFHMDALTTDDFARGNANPYRMVVDTNTCVMDEKQVSDIEAWVRQGGVFVTTTETGRHTPEKADAWPISRLTGYKVASVMRHPKSQKFGFVPEQNVFKPEAWDAGQLTRNGLTLEKTDPACVDLAKWADGSTAVGMRKIGKGAVIHIGFYFNYNPLAQRQIMEWLKLKRLPALCDNKSIFTTHMISNNGLYDVWVLWNQDRSKTVTADFVFRDGLKPTACFDLKTKQPVALVDGVRIADLTFQPFDMRVFLTPRQAIATAGLDWLNLQRGWWRGTKKPAKELQPYVPQFACDLTDDWKMKPLAEADKADTAPMAAVAFDDASWKTARLETWLVPDEADTHRAFFRKKVKVPEAWKSGEIELWMQNWTRDPVRGKLKVWLDGEALTFQGSSISALTLTEKLTPGSTHVLAAEIFSEGQVAGFIGHAWLAYLPKPAASQELSGTWATTKDGLSWTGTTTLPGPWDFSMARRTVAVDRAQANRTVMLRFEVDQPCGIYGALINGRWIMKLHHDVGPRTYLNVTPWIRFGEENEICLVRRDGPGKGTIKMVRLDYFKPE
ncbi:MAG TPA: beta-galactosidase trimerization domain-containing protein [Planctomycetota bacterium]|jgi:hypothetical protein